MKLFACLTMAGLALACGDGGRAGPTRYPDDPSMAWSQSIGPNGVGKSRLVTTPAVGSDGTIYVGGADPSAPVPPVACLYAFNADGSRKQRLCGSDGDHRGAPAIWVATTADGLGAYAVDEAGGLYTMRADGTTAYTMLPDAPPWGRHPTLMGPLTVTEEGLVYVGGFRAIYALDIEDAHEPVKWSFRINQTTSQKSQVYHAALGPDGRIYASGPTLYVFNPAGIRIWETSTGGGSEGAPAVGYEGRLIVRMHRGIMGMTAGGTPAWEFDPGQPTLGAPHLDRRGNIYFSATRALFSTNQVGKLRWELPHDRNFTGAIVVRRGTIYVTDTSGQILAVGLDGSKKWTLSVGARGASPFVDEYGTLLYVAADDSRVYALVPPPSI